MVEKGYFFLEKYKTKKAEDVLFLQFGAMHAGDRAANMWKKMLWAKESVNKLFRLNAKWCGGEH